MRIAFYIYQSKKHRYPGGDHLVRVLVDQMKKYGHEAFLTEDFQEVSKSDLVVLSRAPRHKSYYNAVRLLKKPFIFIAFHDDYIRYDRLQTAFFIHLASVTMKKDERMLHQLIENPEIIHYNDFIPDNTHVLNFPIYKDAKFVMANSRIEREAILRDCKYANVETIYLSPGQFAGFDYSPSDEFLKIVPQLRNTPYILQIGRFECRKNQLGTIFATKDLDIPLVFIAYESFKNERPYRDTCIKAIKKFRKGPTFLISKSFKSRTEKNLTFINVPKDQPITKEVLASAYKNAGLYFHPAFIELPGYVYLEAAKIGTPIVASPTTTIRDYLNADDFPSFQTELIEYVCPYDLLSMKKAIAKQFGRKVSPCKHPILFRQDDDFGKDFAKAIEKHV